MTDEEKMKQRSINEIVDTIIIIVFCIIAPILFMGFVGCGNRLDAAISAHQTETETWGEDDYIIYYLPTEIGTEPEHTW